MALINCTFYAETLGLSTTITVILPHFSIHKTDSKNVSGNPKLKTPNVSDNLKLRTLYLLHGIQDDHTAWVRQTAIERYAAPYGIAVVMPAVQRSFYTDMAFGGAYESFMVDELPKICRYYFPLSDVREDNYIAGLSMGGYGAFKLALNYPEKYYAAASFSGVLDIVSEANNPPVMYKQDFINTFGIDPPIGGTKHDLCFAAQNCIIERKPIPRLYQCCGDQDYLYPNNIAFRDFALQKGLPLTWQADPGYSHSWDYWDLCIQRVLPWMFE
jgi:S-formylglutathione hydrolase FrmB